MREATRGFGVDKGGRVMDNTGGRVMENTDGDAAMATEVETKAGRCATHGDVDASREIPTMGFPFVWFAIARALARRRPFLCPKCGEPVTA